MFDIANKIAYDGQMVKAQKDKPFKCVLGDSCWFNVVGNSIEDKHVVKEELEFLKKRITDLDFSRYEKDIFIITPFLSIKNACEEAFSARTKKNVKCGTVHTFQGREAEIVFLVLGSDPAKAGARHWVAKSPNMLNVAVTRAQRRFFIIGNITLWGGLKYLSQFRSLMQIKNVDPTDGDG